jgi:hypothetical protein
MGADMSVEMSAGMSAEVGGRDGRSGVWTSAGNRRPRRRSMTENSEGDVMVRRDKVVDAKGRSWVSGKLGSEEYFAEARRIARDQARRTVAARLAGRSVRRATS